VVDVVVSQPAEVQICSRPLRMPTPQRVPMIGAKIAEPLGKRVAGSIDNGVGSGLRRFHRNQDRCRLATPLAMRVLLEGEFAHQRVSDGRQRGMAAPSNGAKLPSPVSPGQAGPGDSCQSRRSAWKASTRIVRIPGIQTFVAILASATLVPVTCPLADGADGAEGTATVLHSRLTEVCGEG